MQRQVILAPPFSEYLTDFENTVKIKLVKMKVFRAGRNWKFLLQADRCTALKGKEENVPRSRAVEALPPSSSCRDAVGD